jgi:hypothetical integral membrane protein (TIGR02206 family)
MRNTNFQLFGLTHLAILASIPLLAGILAWLSRKQPALATPVRVTAGALLLLNELIWYGFKIQKGWFLFPGNLPLQLCDLILWMTVIAMLFRIQFAFEFAFFAGSVGATMAVLTPDLWEHFPTYPTVYFFLAHCGIVICVLYLWLSKTMRPMPGCLFRVMAALNAYALALGLFNWTFKTNYMYLCQKPGNASALDYFGPWPFYLLTGELVALAFFALMWLPFRKAAPTSDTASDTPALPSR